MLRIQRLGNTKGFTLVELMIAIAIISHCILGWRPDGPLVGPCGLSFGAIIF